MEILKILLTKGGFNNKDRLANWAALKNQINILETILRNYIPVIEKKEENNIPSINFSLSILSIGLLAVLRRK